MQQLFIDFLKTRRSVTAKKMKRGKISEDHLKKILEAGIRVPDHGALKPWKLSVITGAAQKQLDEELAKAFPEMEKVEEIRKHIWKDHFIWDRLKRLEEEVGLLKSQDPSGLNKEEVEPPKPQDPSDS